MTRRGKRQLTDAEVLAIMRATSAVELYRLSERFGCTTKYAYTIRQQLEPRSLRLAAKYDIDKPPKLPKFGYQPMLSMRGTHPVTPEEKALIAKIMAGDA